MKWHAALLVAMALAAGCGDKKEPATEPGVETPPSVAAPAMDAASTIDAPAPAPAPGTGSDFAMPEVVGP